MKCMKVFELGVPAGKAVGIVEDEEFEVGTVSLQRHPIGRLSRGPILIHDQHFHSRWRANLNRGFLLSRPCSRNAAGTGACGDGKMPRRKLRTVEAQDVDAYRSSQILRNSSHPEPLEAQFDCADPNHKRL